MYSLDTAAARKADTTGSFIKEAGKYIGAFTQAKDIVTKKGGKGIELVFKSASGQTANLAIYTTGPNGEKYQGFEMLMATMTCMNLRNIKPQSGTVMRYDFETKQEVQEPGSVFTELCKPIGVLLETEDYEKQDGSTGTRMVLKNVFQATTELTASEILDRKTTPEQLGRMVAGLRHRPLKGAKPTQVGGNNHAGYDEFGQGSSVGMDEIPF